LILRGLGKFLIDDEDREFRGLSFFVEPFDQIPGGAGRVEPGDRLAEIDAPVRFLVLTQDPGHAKLGKVAENVLLVTGALHPAKHHIGHILVTNRDILSGLEVAITRVDDPLLGCRFVRALVGHLALLGHVDGVNHRRFGQFHLQLEGWKIFLGSLLVVCFDQLIDDRVELRGHDRRGGTLAQAEGREPEADGSQARQGHGPGEILHVAIVRRRHRLFKRLESRDRFGYKRRCPTAAFSVILRRLTMKFAIRVFLVAILGLLVSESTSKAQAPRPPVLEPEAKNRLDALIAAYRSLPAYSDHGEVTLVVKVGDRALKQIQQASIRFARPNKLDVQTDLVRMVSDGTTVTTAVVPLKKYSETPTPKKFAESSFRSGPLGSIEFGGIAGLPLVHVLSLVIGDEPERLIYDFSPKVLAEAYQLIDGVSYKVLRLDESDNHDWRFLIDSRTGLLGFIDLVVEGDATKSSIVGGETHVESLRWAAGAISTEVPAAETFVYQPEPGFVKLGQIAKPVEAKVQAPEHPLVGKAAPDFTLDVLDGPGKLRPVSRADLLGKVVLIDFWATWCGPCLTELPDIQKLIEGYGKANKPVAVVALSIDRAEAGDLKEAREKVEAKLKEMKLSLVAEGPQPVGLIALDPLNKIADRYSVQAIPFVVLVDPQGVIRAVHVGVTSREVLNEEIDALLSGKTVGERK